LQIVVTKRPDGGNAEGDWQKSGKRDMRLLPDTDSLSRMDLRVSAGAGMKRRQPRANHETRNHTRTPVFFLGSTEWRPLQDLGLRNLDQLPLLQHAKITGAERQGNNPITDARFAGARQQFNAAA
jgi:hypothetical protein